MPNWIPVTTANLQDSKVAALIEACDTAALALGQTGRAAGIVQSVVDDIRSKVASCRNNTLDEDTTTIPKSLLTVAVDLILARLKKAIDELLTKDESDDVARHERRLNRIADCKDVVDQPDTAEPAPSTQAAAGTPRTEARTSAFSRTSQEGL